VKKASREKSGEKIAMDSFYFNPMAYSMIEERKNTKLDRFLLTLISIPLLTR